jgi:hypothetical protein
MVLFTIYEKALGRVLKGRESALIHAIVYIDEVQGYKIRHVSYAIYLV